MYEMKYSEDTPHDPKGQGPVHHDGPCHKCMATRCPEQDVNRRRKLQDEPPIRQKGPTRHPLQALTAPWFG
jgi:hypothetical protein